MLKFLVLAAVYIALFVAGIKFYLWGRRQRKKYQKKWNQRLSMLFYFAPIVVFLADLCLPGQVVKTFEFIVNSVEYTISWLEKVVKPLFGTFGYTVLKPAISAVVYAAFGYGLGSIIDQATGKDSTKGAPKSKTTKKRR